MKPDVCRQNVEPPPTPWPTRGRLGQAGPVTAVMRGAEKVISYQSAKVFRISALPAENG